LAVMLRNRFNMPSCPMDDTCPGVKTFLPVFDTSAATRRQSSDRPRRQQRPAIHHSFGRREAATSGPVVGKDFLQNVVLRPLIKIRSFTRNGSSRMSSAARRRGMKERTSASLHRRFRSNLQTPISFCLVRFGFPIFAAPTIDRPEKTWGYCTCRLNFSSMSRTKSWRSCSKS